MKLNDLFIPTPRNKFQAILLKKEALCFLAIVMYIFNSYARLLPVTSVQAEMDLNSIVYLHNRERTKSGEGQLALNSKLIESSTMKSEIMLEHDCWDHYCPPGTSPWELFKKVDYQYAYAGENLAEGFSDDNIMMKAWMNSPTHRANVLKHEFSEIGIGFARGTFQGKNSNEIVTVHFGHPLNASTDLLEFTRETLKPDLTEISRYEIQITHPVSGGVYNTKKLYLQGKLSSSLFNPVLYINSQESIDLIVNENNAFSMSIDYLGIPEGSASITIKARDNAQNIQQSNIVNFQIDDTPILIEESQLKVDRIEQIDDVSNITFSLKSSEPISEAKMIFDQREYPGFHSDSNTIEFLVDYQTISSTQNQNLILLDLAGNESNFVFSSGFILAISQDKFEELGMSRHNMPFTNLLGIISPKIDIDASMFSTQNIINLIIITIILVLIIFDFIVIKKYKDINIYRNGNHFLKLSLLVVISLVVLLASGFGKILTGLTI